MIKPGETKATVAICAQDKLGEGVMWCPDERALYWVDVPLPSKIHRWSPTSGDHQSWTMPEMVTALAKRRDGSLLVASHHGVGAFSPRTGAFERLIEPEAGKPDNRSNDGAPDAMGRFWLGTMCNNIAPDGTYYDAGQTTGVLWRIDADLTAHPMVEGIGISNSVAFSPDGRQLYFADTAQGAIYVCDFDLNRGEISDRRVFSALEGHGYPDGSCVDVEGFLWNARWEGGCVIRFAPDGQVDRVVQIPATRVTCCAFGGPELATMYVTTSRLHLSPAELEAQPDAGALFAFDPGVRGLVRPAFAG